MQRPLCFAVHGLRAPLSFTICPGQTLVLGRKAPADVVLSHVTVGRHHAVLRFGPQACTVEDAQSTSGTWLNDRALRAPAALQPGDEIRLGQVRLIVASADPTPGP